MKRIINGKKYHTETANNIVSNVSTIALFRKDCGEFFIYQYDGIGTESITPIDDSEARIFLEKYGTSDKYEEIFGEVQE